MNTKEKGDLTEAKVIPRLIERGYDVSIPFNETVRYDMIIDRNNKLYRVQVKSSRFKDGTIRFSTSDMRSNNTENKRKFYTDEDIESFIVYSEETNSIYWIPVNEAPKTSMRLRVSDDLTKTAPVSTINWAEEYEM